MGLWDIFKSAPDFGPRPEGGDALVDWCARRALYWAERHSLRRQGVLCTTAGDFAYPEVSGYYIPTLLDWDRERLAFQYARWLIRVQRRDGAWGGPGPDGDPYSFDVGQILKGLVAILPKYPEARAALVRGCEWLLGQFAASGQLTTPCDDAHLMMDGSRVPDAFHLYALQGLREAGRVLGREDFVAAVARSVDYYRGEEAVGRFRTLSHFHAYILEALWDLGCQEEARAGMDEVAAAQREDGAVPGVPGGVDWVCSTGLAQYALIWLKMGEPERARRAMEWLCAHQNEGGGFYGCYGGGWYFPEAEISWAVKYFLDAARWLRGQGNQG